jgi:phenylpyruvate tautomerase PptA (4-oxalocrotonate tautomerase family)
MPMIDVYATAGTFSDKHQLAADLAGALMRIEGVPDIPMFRQNTAAFIHDLPAGDLSNVDGDSGYVRVQVLTNAGALDRAKQVAVVSQFTSMVASAAGDPALAERTWVLLTEAVQGGWGLLGHANTNDELVAAARRQIAELQAGAGGSSAASLTKAAPSKRSWPRCSSGPATATTPGPCGTLHGPPRRNAANRLRCS